MNKTSHHPRLVQIEEKEEKDDSDVQKFTVHELCLSDRADVILPCLPQRRRQLAATQHRRECDHNRIVQDCLYPLNAIYTWVTYGSESE